MDDTIPQPRPRLTDEAAAQMLDFLYEFIADFEPPTTPSSAAIPRRGATTLGRSTATVASPYRRRTL